MPPRACGRFRRSSSRACNPAVRLRPDQAQQLPRQQALAEWLTFGYFFMAPPESATCRGRGRAAP
jgi:hypothetical protein